MYSLNNIVQLLKDYQSQNEQVKSFFFGDVFDFGIEKERLYPAMTSVLQPSALNEFSEDFNFQIGFWDKIELENGGQELEVLSDTRKMCKDIVAYLFQTDNDLEIELPITITSVSGKFGDELGGSFFDIKIKQSQDLNLCQIPLN